MSKAYILSMQFEIWDSLQFEIVGDNTIVHDTDMLLTCNMYTHTGKCYFLFMHKLNNMWRKPSASNSSMYM